jgi:hypothetical protein
MIVKNAASTGAAFFLNIVRLSVSAAVFHRHLESSTDKSCGRCAIALTPAGPVST